MKLITAIQTTSEIKFDINVQNYNGKEWYTFHIDYLNDAVKDYGAFGFYDHSGHIPNAILYRDVLNISVNSCMHILTFTV